MSDSSIAKKKKNLLFSNLQLFMFVCLSNCARSLAPPGCPKDTGGRTSARCERWVVWGSRGLALHLCSGRKRPADPINVFSFGMQAPATGKIWAPGSQALPRAAGRNARRFPTAQTWQGSLRYFDLFFLRFKVQQTWKYPFAQLLHVVEGGTGTARKKSSLRCFEAAAVVPKFASPRPHKV